MRLQKSESSKADTDTLLEVDDDREEDTSSG